MTDAHEANPTPNPFDPAALRLDQSFADTVGVKKLLTTVPVRKPNRQDFVRVHPDPKYRLTPAAIIEVKEDREIYLITPNMAQVLPGEFSTATLYLAINRQGVSFLWPVKLPNPDGKHNEWHRSAAEAAERAMGKWVRVNQACRSAPMKSPKRVGTILIPCGQTIPSRKFLGSPSAIASWIVQTTPWSSDFGGSCSHGGTNGLSPLD